MGLTMPCRICLEDEEPFISPCDCIGTMKDVHEICLIRWMRTKENLDCEVCHVPLLLEFNYPMERAAYFKGFQLQFLTNPVMYIISHSILMMFFCTSNNFMVFIVDRFLKFQFAFNWTYLFLLYYLLKTRVRNKQRYLYHLLSFPYIGMLLANIFLWIKLIETHEYTNITHFIIYSLINQSCMASYIIVHNSILDRINGRRIATFLPRRIREDSHETVPS